MVFNVLFDGITHKHNICSSAITPQVRERVQLKTRHVLVHERLLIGSVGSVSLSREKMENNKKNKFCFKKFATFNNETKKFTCLVETCKRELSGKRSNLKRHYRLVHNMLIDKEETLPKVIKRRNIIIKLNRGERERMEIKNKNFSFEKFATFNNETKRFTCLVETCKRELSSASTLNLKRHYKLMHNIVIDKEETLPKAIKRKNIIIKLNRDKWERMGIKSKNFDFKKFATLNKETKRFTCLIETCKRELSGTSIFNLKRHYKLMHNIVIDEMETLPDVIKKENVTEFNTTLDIDERGKMENRKFCFEKFATYNDEAETLPKVTMMDNITKFDTTLNIDERGKMENSKRRKFCFEKFATYNDETKKFTCVIETCKKEVSASNTSNIKRHYKLIHNIIIDEAETIPKVTMVDNITKFDTTLNIDEWRKMENNKIRKLRFEKFATYNDETNKFTCLVETCKTELCATNTANLKRHYKVVHNIIIDEAETIPKVTMTDNITKFDTTLNIDERRKMENNKIRKHRFEKFATYNDKTNKFTCLVETCKKELCATNPSNIKRHYKLIHNIDIDEMETLPNGVSERNIITKFTFLNRDEFLKCCVGLVSKKYVPLSIFDDRDFFKKITKPYEEKFEISLNSKIIANILDDASQQMKRAIVSTVRNKMICLKIDIAGRQNKNILGVNIQYIHDFKICRNNIGTIQLNEACTAEYLKEKIMKCLEEYSIDIEQIYSSTADNGANVIQDSKLLEELQDENLATEDDDEFDNTNAYNIIEIQLPTVFSMVQCAAQTIQLAVNDVIATLKQEIMEVRDIVKKIRTIIKTGNQNISLPSLDNASKWNSTYDMIISILALKEYINGFDHSTNISVNWVFVESFATAFKPLAELGLHMQKEQYIIGDFYRDWLECELELQDIIQTNETAEAIHEAMVKRIRKLLEHNAFIAALYLDPRFNFEGTPLLTSDQKQTAMDHLIKTYKMINHISDSTSSQDENENNSISEYSSSLDTTPSTSNAAHSKLAQHINYLVNVCNLTSANSNDIKPELLALCQQRMEPLQIDVLEYWKKNQRSLKLSRLAQVVLAVPVI